MFSIIKRLSDIIRREGILSAIRGSFGSLYKNFFFFICYPKINSIKKESNTKRLVDFVSDNCYGFIRPLQVKEELSDLIKEMEKSNPRFVLEIGTSMGGTLFLFTRKAKADATIISIDLPGGLFGGGYFQPRSNLYRRFCSNRQKMFLLRADSHRKETYRKVAEILGENKLDFLFIDGDHTYEGVKRDFKMYKPLVKKGGLIGLHDVAKHPKESGCNVDKFWKEIRQKYKYKEIINDKDQGWAGIGILINK